MFLKQNECVIVTAIYPNAKKFIKKFIKSLSIQTNKRFDLVIYNDGLRKYKKYFKNFKINYLVLSLNKKKYPSELRAILIKKTLNLGYKKLIFADIDDVMKKNRIFLVNKLLNKYDIVVNDINLYKKNSKPVKNYFSKRLKKNSVFNLGKIMNGNFMGFTNTAAQSSVFLNKTILKSVKTETYDWYLWSRCMLNKKIAFFTNKTSTNYTVNYENKTSLPHVITKNYIKKQIDLKFKHYKLMVQLNYKYNQFLKRIIFLKNIINKEKDFKTIMGKINIKKNNFWCEI